METFVLIANASLLLVAVAATAVLARHLQGAKIREATAGERVAAKEA